MIASESIWVGMRLRPLGERERGQRHCLRIEDKQVYVSTEALDAKQQLDVQKKAFAFDVAMDSTDPNSPEYERCYELMGERMVQHMLQGFNTCLFCYGQTGTGKTTTIMGNAGGTQNRSCPASRRDGACLWDYSMIRGTGGMISQAEEGMKLFEAQQGSAAEVDTAGAETLDQYHCVNVMAAELL
eukprot:g10291.t1